MNRAVIINSRLDPGGSNIHDRLIASYPFKQIDKKFDGFPVYEHENVVLVTTNSEIVRVGQDLDNNFGAEGALYVFVSKHRAESGIPSLTAHFTGNFGSAADFGGNPKQISKHMPSLLKNYMLSLSSLRERIPKKYNLTLEATHHGPTALKRPSLFVEIGSSEEEWDDVEGGLCVATALMKSLAIERKFTPCAIGLGGTHYPEKFNKLILERDIAFGIIAPKYALGNIDEQMMRQLIEKSEEEITLAAVDVKGLGKEKQRILNLVEALGLELLKV